MCIHDGKEENLGDPIITVHASNLLWPMFIVWYWLFSTVRERINKSMKRACWTSSMRIQVCRSRCCCFFFLFSSSFESVGFDRVYFDAVRINLIIGFTQVLSINKMIQGRLTSFKRPNQAFHFCPDNWLVPFVFCYFRISCIWWWWWCEVVIAPHRTTKLTKHCLVNNYVAIIIIRPNSLLVRLWHLVGSVGCLFLFIIVSRAPTSISYTAYSAFHHFIK